MKDGDISIPETRRERLVDALRHLYHRVVLSRRIDLDSPTPFSEDWDPPPHVIALSLDDS